MYKISTLENVFIRFNLNNKSFKFNSEVIALKASEVSYNLYAFGEDTDIWDIKSNINIYIQQFIAERWSYKFKTRNLFIFMYYYK